MYGLIDSFQSGKGKSVVNHFFQQMVLEKLDIHMQIQILIYILYYTQKVKARLKA